VTTNGESDLKRAKRIITLLVTKFGMSPRLKHIAFPDTEFVRKPYSSQIEIIVDEEIQLIANECK
jgi:ATP-dependent Zn protease